MEMKKAKIAGKLMDVVSMEEYVKNSEGYNPSSTAIEFKEQGIALPVINRFDASVGINVSQNKLFGTINPPKEEDLDKYSTKDMIDLADVKNLRELMEKQEAVRDIEYDMLTNVDNIFQPKIGENCTPAMRALKTAVNDKNIDIHKYQARFGSNFNNDIRQFNKDKISLDMLERMCKCLDIKATLILEDMSDDIANPMGHTISVNLIEEGNDEDE